MKLTDLTESLETMGWDFIVGRLKAGDKIFVTKETLAKMVPLESQRNWNLDAKRNATLDDYDAEKRALFLMPCKTAYSVTVGMKMTPQKQEGWIVKKHPKTDKAWLCWRNL